MKRLRRRLAWLLVRLAERIDPDWESHLYRGLAPLRRLAFVLRMRMQIRQSRRPSRYRYVVVAV